MFSRRVGLDVTTFFTAVHIMADFFALLNWISKSGKLKGNLGFSPVERAAMLIPEPYPFLWSPLGNPGRDHRQSFIK